MIQYPAIPRRSAPVMFSYLFSFAARFLKNLLVEGLANVGKPELASSTPLGSSNLLSLGLLRLGAKEGVNALDTRSPALMVAVSCAARNECQEKDFDAAATFNTSAGTEFRNQWLAPALLGQ
jgi:hypothetical protein